MASRHVKALVELLAQEHKALTAGALDKIPELTAKKEVLMQRLATAGATGPELTFISNAVARNQTLLEAAMQGVRAAQGRLKTLEAPRTESVVYDKSGAVSRIGGTGKGLSQKL